MRAYETALVAPSSRPGTRAASTMAFRTVRDVTAPPQRFVLTPFSRRQALVRGGHGGQVGRPRLRDCGHTLGDQRTTSGALPGRSVCWVSPYQRAADHVGGAIVEPMSRFAAHERSSTDDGAGLRGYQEREPAAALGLGHRATPGTRLDVVGREPATFISPERICSLPNSVDGSARSSRLRPCIW
jgi:hypothetical protein